MCSPSGLNQLSPQKDEFRINKQTQVLKSFRRGKSVFLTWHKVRIKNLNLYKDLALEKGHVEKDSLTQRPVKDILVSIAYRLFRG